MKKMILSTAALLTIVPLLLVQTNKTQRRKLQIVNQLLK